MWFGLSLCRLMVLVVGVKVLLKFLFCMLLVFLVSVFRVLNVLW